MGEIKVTYKNDVLRAVQVVDRYGETLSFNKNLKKHIKQNLERAAWDKIATLTPCLVNKIKFTEEYVEDLGHTILAEVQVVQIHG